METDQINSPAAKTPSRSSRALGRGLEALLPPVPQAAPPTDGVLKIPVSQIDPNPYQARHYFDPERLKELAESIRRHGVMQPIVVRKAGDRYLLIAGERRWRATTLAGIPAIPALVREVREDQVLELTLIENIQREDLNPIEVAEALARLATDAALTHEQIAERTGKDRATVTNFLRLLKLPQEVRQHVASGTLSMGHAKALLGLPTEAAQNALAEKIVAEALSVRQTELLVKKQSHPFKGSVQAIEKESLRDPNVQAAIHELERALGTRVKLLGNEYRGRLIVEYYSPEDLDRIYAVMMGRK